LGRKNKQTYRKNEHQEKEGGTSQSGKQRKPKSQKEVLTKISQTNEGKRLKKKIHTQRGSFQVPREKGGTQTTQMGTFFQWGAMKSFALNGKNQGARKYAKKPTKKGKKWWKREQQHTGKKGPRNGKNHSGQSGRTRPT